MTARKKKPEPPKERIPLPKKPPKIERDKKKEEERRKGRKPVEPEEWQALKTGQGRVARQAVFARGA